MEYDVVNAYLNAPYWEKIWLAAGPDHGLEKTSKIMVMVRDLYDLKSSGEAWRSVFIDTLCNIDVVTMVADIDVYRRWARKPNGEDYYELMLIYVDCVLCCSHNPQMIMDAVALMYYLKYRSVGTPKGYLGAEIKKYQVRCGKYHWSMPITQYMKNTIKTIEVLLKDEDRQLRKVKTAENSRFQTYSGRNWSRVISCDQS